MSSMHEVVRALGGLAEQVDRASERASTVTTQLDETRSRLQQLGADGVADELAEMRLQIYDLDGLLARAALGSGTVKQRAESIQAGNDYGLGPRGVVRYGPPQTVPADLILHLVAGPCDGKILALADDCDPARPADGLAGRVSEAGHGLSGARALGLGHGPVVG